MCPSRGPIIALAALLATARGASAETIPQFDLHRRTAEVECVAHGRLDAKGGLTVDAMLKGKAPGKKVDLTNGAYAFAELKKLEKGAISIEVVIYLNRSGGKWEVAQGDNGVVGFLGNGVCLVREDKNNPRPGGAALGRHRTLTREAFLKQARAAVAALERRKLLLALPPSADRMGKIAAFWLALDREGRYHHAHELSRALRPVSLIEEKALAALLKSSAATSKPALLDLTGCTARGKFAFDAVAELLDRRRPDAVRRAAIDALTYIDPYRAQGRLIPLLRVDETELQTVLEVLSGADPACLDPAVVEALRKLTLAVRRLHRDDREALARESEALVAVLWHYGDPKFLPLLVEWTLSDNHVSAEFVECGLRRGVGLSPRQDAGRWARWWEKAKPLVEADYDLRGLAGRRKWYHAYRQADAATRRLLLRSWPLEPAPDEAAMVREAGGEGGDVAKVVLAELWGLDRLSADTKGALVGKFLSVRLEEVPGLPITRSRELRVVGEKRFPFPPAVWVDHAASIAIGDDREPKLEGSSGRLSLGEGAGPYNFGSLGGGSYPGTPQARAIVELSEYVPSGSGKVGWKRTWKLGPIRLREAK